MLGDEVKPDAKNDRYFESVFKEIMLPIRVTTFASNEGL